MLWPKFFLIVGARVILLTYHINLHFNQSNGQYDTSKIPSSNKASVKNFHGATRNG